MSNCFESKCLRRTLGIKTEQIYRKCWDLSGPSSTLGLKKKVRKREGNENDLSQGREAVGQHSRESKESLCWGLMGAEKVQIYQHRDRFRTEWDNGYCWGLLGGWDTFQTPGHLQKCHFSNLQRIDVIFFFFEETFSSRSRRSQHPSSQSWALCSRERADLSEGDPVLDDCHNCRQDGVFSLFISLQSSAVWRHWFVPSLPKLLKPRITPWLKLQYWEIESCFTDFRVQAFKALG